LTLFTSGPGEQIGERMERSYVNLSRQERGYLHKYESTRKAADKTAAENKNTFIVSLRRHSDRKINIKTGK
jgi:hypothetical protein